MYIRDHQSESASWRTEAIVEIIPASFSIWRALLNWVYIKFRWTDHPLVDSRSDEIHNEANKWKVFTDHLQEVF